MRFVRPFHDLGKVRKGEQRQMLFEFVNTGTETLEIDLVSGCDCSIIDWPSGERFAPGEKGKIKVTFDSSREDEFGKMTKTLDIILVNEDPKTGYPIIEELKYRLELIR